MKILILSVFTVLSSQSFAAQTVNSSSKNAAEVVVARVVELVNLVTTDSIMVNVAVEDLGGSTNVSPTQTVYLTMYSKGEMFSTDATFKIADVLSFDSAKRISAGIYELNVVTFDGDGIKSKTLLVDARTATIEIQNVKCDSFDCDASSNFSTSISVTTK